VQDFRGRAGGLGYLEEVGITASVETMDWPSYIGRITAPADEQEQDLHLLGWAPSYMDSFQHMVIFQTDQQPPDGLATAFYANSEVDELLAAAAVELDEGARQDLYCEASEIIWEEAPWIFMYSQRFPIATGRTRGRDLPAERELLRGLRAALVLIRPGPAGRGWCAGHPRPAGRT
jgi:ABC-type transport system substrate-binding protein